MKNVVITGASRGIGKATAEKFLKEGFKVFGSSTSGELSFSDEKLVPFQLDMTSPDSIEQAAEFVIGNVDEIAHLINNAAVADDLSDGGVDITKLRKTLEVNLIGLISFAELMVDKIEKGGSVVNVSSTMGSLEETRVGAYAPSYRISKSALNMYTKYLASRLEDKNVAVSSVCPGWVKTDMGGPGAVREPHESADEIYELATKRVKDFKTGMFWTFGKVRSW